MSEPISTPPWDLAAGNCWTIQSEDHRIANDRGNETVVDAQGNVVAYVSGNNDEGGNGALLSAAPAMAQLLLRAVEVLGMHPDWCECWECGWTAEARAALKQAGAL